MGRHFLDGGKIGSSEGAETLIWSVFPARNYPRKTVIALSVILAFCLFVLWRTGSIIWVVFSAAVLFFSLSRFFLPTHYTLTPASLTIVFMGVSRRRAWSDFRRADGVKGGVFLSPFASPSRMDSYRGLFLLCGNNKPEVLEFVRKRIHGQNIIPSEDEERLRRGR